MYTAWQALWVIATNPLVSFPNVDVLKQGFDNLEFLVVQDGIGYLYHLLPYLGIRLLIQTVQKQKRSSRRDFL